MTKIKAFLTNDKTQRALYLFGIALWTFIWWMDDLKSQPQKSFNWTWLVPTLFLIIQIFFNNRWVWKLIFTIVTLFFFLIIALSIKVLIINGTLYSLMPSLIAIFATAFILWILFHIKPRQELKKHVA